METMMINMLENMKTATLYRQAARSERHTQEAEKKEDDFMRKLNLAGANMQDKQEVKSVLNGADAESKRNQLMMMTML